MKPFWVGFCCGLQLPFTWRHTRECRESVSRFGQRRPGPRALVCVSYQDGERLLLENAGWRLAPEEDRNRDMRVVYLERPAEQHSGEPK